MKIHISKAFNKYGIYQCKIAHDQNTHGEGAATIGWMLGLTTRQADAAINAWAAMLASFKAGDEVHGLGERFAIEQHGSRFTIRRLPSNT
jgi:hypothetical protein